MKNKGTGYRVASKYPLKFHEEIYLDKVVKNIF